MEDIFHVQRIHGRYSFTDEQKELIINLYTKELKPLKTITKMFHLGSTQFVKRILVEANVYEGCRQGHPIDEHFFDEINTPQKAYWLGFLYADGTVSEKNGHVSITSIDYEHIEKFRDAIGSKNKITKVEDNRFSKLCVYYVFSTKSKTMVSSLIKYGCVPKKSLIIEGIPNIPTNMVSHFIRGYFDGDGSIHTVVHNEFVKKYDWRISFNGTCSFLEDIKEFLGVGVKIRQSSTGKDFVIQINGSCQLNRVLGTIYQDSEENIRLNRKYEKYQKFLQDFGCISLEPVNTGCALDDVVDTGNGVEQEC